MSSQTWLKHCVLSTPDSTMLKIVSSAGASTINIFSILIGNLLENRSAKAVNFFQHLLKHCKIKSVWFRSLQTLTQFGVGANP